MGSLAASSATVETYAATETASREAADTHAAIELASIPRQGEQTAPHASLNIAAVAAIMIVVGIFIVPGLRKPRHPRVLEPLLDVAWGVSCYFFSLSVYSVLNPLAQVLIS